MLQEYRAVSELVQHIFHAISCLLLDGHRVLCQASPERTIRINRLLELVRKTVLISISWVLRLPALDIPRREAHGFRCVGDPMLKWSTNKVSWPRQVQGHLMPSQRVLTFCGVGPAPGWSPAPWDPRLSDFQRRRFLINKHHV